MELLKTALIKLTPKLMAKWIARLFTSKTVLAAIFKMVITKSTLKNQLQAQTN